MKKFAPVVALLGGLLLIFGSRLPEVDFGKLIPVAVSESLEGSTLYLIHEKLSPTPEKVLDVRRAPEFVKTYKFAGFVNMDEDEETLANLLKEAQDKYKVSPPMLVAQKGAEKVIRIRKWEKGLEDILK